MRTRQSCVSKNSEESKAPCIISFDNESLLRAKEKLLTSKLYYLFYVHLEKRPVSKPFGRKQGRFVALSIRL